MATRYAVVYGLTYGHPTSLTLNGHMTHVTVDTRERAEEIAAELNTPEGIDRLHKQIAANPEYSDREMIRTTPAEVVELPD